MRLTVAESLKGRVRWAKSQQVVRKLTRGRDWRLQRELGRDARR